MARDLTAAQSAAVAAPTIYAAMLVELEFSPDPVRLWSGIGEFAWGNRTFTGAGTLLGISAVEETAEIRAAGTTISLSAIPADVMAGIQDVSWQGSPARIWLALFDAAGDLIGDPRQVFAGRMDTLSWTEGATATIALTLESRLVDLDRPRVRRYTDADQQAEYPGDLGLQYVATLVEKEIAWGR